MQRENSGLLQFEVSPQTLAFASGMQRPSREGEQLFRAVPAVGG